MAEVGKMWFWTGKKCSNQVNAVNENLFFGFWFPAITWLFSATLRACKCSEWDRCREQRDEFTRHRGPSNTAAERERETEMHRWAHRLLIEVGENEREWERNCIYFCPWSVEGLVDQPRRKWKFVSWHLLKKIFETMLNSFDMKLKKKQK